MHGWQPESILSVVVGSDSNVVNALLYSRPTTGLKAKFSISFCIATVVVRGRAGLSEFTTETVNSPEIQEFLQKVELVVDPELEFIGYQHVRTRVHVYLVGGEEFEGEAQRAKGYPDNPLSRSELSKKFESCVTPVLKRNRLNTTTYQALFGMADETDICNVMALFH